MEAGVAALVAHRSLAASHGNGHIGHPSGDPTGKAWSPSSRGSSEAASSDGDRDWLRGFHQDFCARFLRNMSIAGFRGLSTQLCLSVVEPLERAGASTASTAANNANTAAAANQTAQLSLVRWRAKLQRQWQSKPPK